MAIGIVLHTPTPDEHICSELDTFDPQPTSVDKLGDPRAAVLRIAQAIVDVVNGQRPLAQLNPWVTAEVLDQLRPIVARAAAQRQTVRTSLRSNRAGLPRVITHRASSPAYGVVEGSVVVSGRPRSRALALRLEGLDGRWRCTAILTC